MNWATDGGRSTYATIILNIIIPYRKYWKHIVMKFINFAPLISHAVKTTKMLLKK